MSEPTEPQIQAGANALAAAMDDFTQHRISVLGLREGVCDADGIVRLTFTDAARIVLSARVPEQRNPR